MREVESKLSNSSLSYLEQVVLALSEHAHPPRMTLPDGRVVALDEYIPFRQAALTHCLKSALLAKNKTVLIATIAPEQKNLEEMVYFSFDKT